jgi:FPC/CPF motif-containing protein YcgG
MAPSGPISALERFIQAAAFPCVGAKAALNRDTLTIVEAEAIDSAKDDLDIYKALTAFGESLDPEASTVQSFAVVFHGPRDVSETAFEKAMWDRLQCLHNLDAATGRAWSGDAATDPSSAHFAMSVGEHAYFVVGMHPAASRPARRFDYPAMVFNAHEQFERLRADGRYGPMKETIRARDEELAGDINPMLDDFGESSEASQYSGRAVGPEWDCPFEYKEPEEPKGSDR